MAATTDQPTPQTNLSTRTCDAIQSEVRRRPHYHVVLLDDDDHTYEYVIGMLRKLFALPTEQGYRLACEVDNAGRVIVDTTTLERAELKRDQIHDFGRDWRILRCSGSMRSILEPVETK
ncbi:MAG: ATP-dependent Clp protease adaptor ClpS [Planctomycetota bacterium]